MPAYDYECGDCGNRFEVRQAMSEAPLTRCPECGGTVKRLIGPGAGVVIRGSWSGGRAGRGGCSLEESGRTCCGRKERCGSPACGGDE